MTVEKALLIAQIAKAVKERGGLRHDVDNAVFLALSV